MFLRPPDGANLRAKTGETDRTRPLWKVSGRLLLVSYLRGGLQISTTAAARCCRPRYRWGDFASLDRVSYGLPRRRRPSETSTGGRPECFLRAGRPAPAGRIRRRPESGGGLRGGCGSSPSTAPAPTCASARRTWPRKGGGIACAYPRPVRRRAGRRAGRGAATTERGSPIWWKRPWPSSSQI